MTLWGEDLDHAHHTNLINSSENFIFCENKSLQWTARYLKITLGEAWSFRWFTRVQPVDMVAQEFCVIIFSTIKLTNNLISNQTIATMIKRDHLKLDVSSLIMKFCWETGDFVFYNWRAPIPTELTTEIRTSLSDLPSRAQHKTRTDHRARTPLSSSRHGKLRQHAQHKKYLNIHKKIF